MCGMYVSYAMYGMYLLQNLEHMKFQDSDEMADEPELLNLCEEILKCVSEGEKDEKTAVAGKL